MTISTHTGEVYEDYTSYVYGQMQSAPAPGLDESILETPWPNTHEVDQPATGNEIVNDISNPVKAGQQYAQAPSAEPLVSYNARDLSSYMTTLSPEEETSFQEWKKTNAPNDSGYDYDFRGAFKAGVTPAENGHWPDTFKKPNHPTFSIESQYSKYHPELAGRWEGETYIPPSKSTNPRRGRP